MPNRTWARRLNRDGACAAGAALGLGLFSATPSLGATPRCDAATARLAAPAGMTIGAISDLNPELPAAPTGAILVPESGNTPAYCLLTGSVITHPDTHKTANFGLALPRHWNHKLLFSGCRGYCGVVFQNPPHASGGGYPTDALAKGYAILATDDGHESTPVGDLNDASWALAGPGAPNTDAMADYFHRAVHRVTVHGKQLVQSWYSRDLVRSYFFGCSDGGREGMMEATRYPDDFDGYIVGAPRFDLPGQILSGRGSMALLDSPDAHVAPALLSLVDNTIYANCDAADGVRDRLIQDPGKCSFRPKSLLCRGDYGGACLTGSQVRTLTTWFSAARDEKGRVVSHGFPVSDIYNDGAPGDTLFTWLAAGPRRSTHRAPWSAWTSAQPNSWAFMDQSMKYLVHWDPGFNTRRKPPVNARGVVRDKTWELLVARTDAGSADSPGRLYPFLAANRKLILYHGYSDGWVSPFRTVRFYRTWAKRVGGYDVLQKNARFFTVPGMHHCSHGPGPNVFDALGALEQWVEGGMPPDSMVATKYKDDDPSAAPIRSMPLCPFPTQASYTAGGDVNAADTWSCKPNELLLRVGENGAAAGLHGPAR